jgi:hypothetical protein
MSTYIKPEDIKSNIATGFDLSGYLDETDDEMVDMAERLGVRTVTDIQNAPLHYRIKRYLIEFLLTRLCEDKAGTNNPDTVEFDKYFALAEYHRRRGNELKNGITAEMVTGEVNEIGDRVLSTGMLFRG